MIRKLIIAVGLVLALPAFAAPKNGEAAPDFTLKSSEGKDVKLSSYKGKTVVLEWFNKDCPFVRKHYDSGNMQKTQKAAADKGVVWLRVATGKTAAEEAKSPSKEKDANTPVLLDKDGKVGKEYGAKTTPHLFVINPKGLLAYSGAIDDKDTADASDIPTSKNLVAAAVDEVVGGKKVTEPFHKPYGCGVKY